METSRNHRHLTETERKLARELGTIRKLIDLVGRNAAFDLSFVADGGYWVVSEKKNGGRMQIDDGVLDRRRWVSLGVIALVLVAGVVVLAVTGAPSSARPVALTPVRYPTLAPAPRVGDRVYVRGPYAARDASSSAARVVCQLDPTQTGVLYELGASLASTRLDWGRVSIGGCTGWITLDDLGKATK